MTGVGTAWAGATAAAVGMRPRGGQRGHCVTKTYAGGCRDKTCYWIGDDPFGASRSGVLGLAGKKHRCIQHSERPGPTQHRAVLRDCVQEQGSLGMRQFKEIRYGGEDCTQFPFPSCPVAYQ